MTPHYNGSYSRCMVQGLLICSCKIGNICQGIWKNSRILSYQCILCTLYTCVYHHQKHNHIKTNKKHSCSKMALERDQWNGTNWRLRIMGFLGTKGDKIRHE